MTEQELERWEKTATEPSPWRSRLVKMSEYIVPGETVLDVGAGSMELRSLLPDHCRYIPLDIVPGAPDTIICNLDDRSERQALVVRMRGLGITTAVVSGVLEYVEHPNMVLRTLLAVAPRVLFSYDSNNDMEKRLANGWKSHWVAAAFTVLGAKRIDTWQDQDIYELK